MAVLVWGKLSLAREICLCMPTYHLFDCKWSRAEIGSRPIWFESKEDIHHGIRDAPNQRTSTVTIRARCSQRKHRFHFNVISVLLWQKSTVKSTPHPHLAGMCALPFTLFVNGNNMINIRTIFARYWLTSQRRMKWNRILFILFIFLVECECIRWTTKNPAARMWRATRHMLDPVVQVWRGGVRAATDKSSWMHARTNDSKCIGIDGWDNVGWMEIRWMLDRDFAVNNKQ